MVTARELVLSRRPQRRMEPGCFTLVERKLPALSQGQLLVRADCFSVDPSMIPRLSVDTYAAAFELGLADILQLLLDPRWRRGLSAEACNLARMGGRKATGRCAGEGGVTTP